MFYDVYGVWVYARRLGQWPRHLLLLSQHPLSAAWLVVILCPVLHCAYLVDNLVADLVAVANLRSGDGSSRE